MSGGQGGAGRGGTADALRGVTEARVAEAEPGVSNLKIDLGPEARSQRTGGCGLDHRFGNREEV